MCRKKNLTKITLTLLVPFFSINYSIASNVAKVNEAKNKVPTSYSLVSSINSSISLIIFNKNKIATSKNALVQLYNNQKFDTIKKSNLVNLLKESYNLITTINKEITIKYKFIKSYFKLQLMFNLIKKIYFMLKTIALMISIYILHYLIFKFIKIITYFYRKKQSNNTFIAKE